jgi:kynurenine formamidase
MIRVIVTGLIAGTLVLPALALDLDDYQVVDLSHVYSSETLYWPTSPSRFERQELSFGATVGGWFYSAYSICTPEHGGTHLDAPLHFASDGLPTDRIPLENLVGNAVVIDVSNLEFPSYGADAARVLVDERRVAVLGVDTASTDYGKSTDFVLHRIAAAQNVSGLEYLTNLDRLPPTGALIIALPMKIEGGSGEPVRVVALVPTR